MRGRRYFGNTSNTTKAPCGARGAYDLRVVIASEAYDHNAQRKTLESFVFFVFFRLLALLALFVCPVVRLV